VGNVPARIPCSWCQHHQSSHSFYLYCIMFLLGTNICHFAGCFDVCNSKCNKHYTNHQLVLPSHRSAQPQHVTDNSDQSTEWYSTEQILKVCVLHMILNLAVKSLHSIFSWQGICSPHPRFVSLPGMNIPDIPIPDDMLPKSLSAPQTGYTVLKPFLQQHGREADRVLGDGNCLFQTLSWALTGVEDHHKTWGEQ